MKSFLIKSLFFLLCSFCIVWAAVLICVDGRSDYYYLKFTSPQQKSLILGASEAAQGLLPHVLNKGLRDMNVELPIYNYAFTRVFSPYGKDYLNSIKKKMDPSAKNGIFILSVTPWNISVSKKLQDKALFPEAETMIVKVKDVNSNPNWEYLFKSYSKPYYSLFQKSKELTLHEDGWTEVTVPMDSFSVKKRIEKKVNKFVSNDLINQEYSPVRFSYFKETISFLKKHGKVYIVSLPTAPEIVNINHEYMPDFEHKISVVASQLGVKYLDYSTEEGYQTTDGVHLYKEAGKQLTLKILEAITQDLKDER